MDSGGVTKYESVVSVIRKPPSGRNDFMVNDLIPWFRKRSRLFESLKTEILFDVIKNVAFLSCQRDDVLIREGDQGDCMYIILRGSVGIYRLPEELRIHEEEVPTTTQSTTTTTTTTATSTTPSSSSTIDINGQTKVKESVRPQLGERVAGLGEPSTFGDVALMSEDCIRTASVIVDEPSDFIVFDRDLYNRSVKSVLKKEFEDKTNFIDRSHYFRSWQPRYRKQLAMAMVKETVPFNAELTKQGNPVDTIYFLLAGEVKVTVDPSQHRTQFPKILTKAGPPTEKIRSDRSVNNKQEQTNTSMQTDQSRRRWRPNATGGPGASGAMGKRTASSVEVCLLGINECVGDIEVLMELTTYLQTSTCTQRTEVLILETRHFERLFTRRHPRTVDRMKEDLMTRLQFRLSPIRRQSSSVPLLNKLLEKVEEYNRRVISQTAARQLRSWASSVKEEKIERSGSGMFDGFVPHQGALIDIQGPGTVFHLIRQREKVRLARLTKGRRMRWPGFGMGLTARRLRFGKRLLKERMEEGEDMEDGREDGRGSSAASGGASASELMEKTLEERLKMWHLSHKTHAWTVRDKPLIAELHRTQTESLVRQAAGIHVVAPIHVVSRPKERVQRQRSTAPQRRVIRIEQGNKKTFQKKVKDVKKKDLIRVKVAEDKGAFDIMGLAQFENDILLRQSDSWV